MWRRPVLWPSGSSVDFFHSFAYNERDLSKSPYMRKEKFMNIYVVDFENVNSQGLNGIDRLDSTDQVIIFYSENADSMTFDLHEQINK